jgi:mono/diheme cytochrome c family protein
MVYTTFCTQCHGEAGRGGAQGGSIIDPNYLALVSDQHLRTTVITGRPDRGKPDWRANVPGQPMTPQDISDVVAWLAAQRPSLAARASSEHQTTSARQAH